MNQRPNVRMRRLRRKDKWKSGLFRHWIVDRMAIYVVFVSNRRKGALSIVIDGHRQRSRIEAD